jgi:hypothetical protein
MRCVPLDLGISSWLLIGAGAKLGESSRGRGLGARGLEEVLTVAVMGATMLGEWSVGCAAVHVGPVSRAALAGHIGVFDRAPSPGMPTGGSCGTAAARHTTRPATVSLAVPLPGRSCATDMGYDSASGGSEAEQAVDGEASEPVELLAWVSL